MNPHADDAPETLVPQYGYTITDQVRAGPISTGWEDILRIENRNNEPFLTISKDRVLTLGKGVTCEDAAREFVKYVNENLLPPSQKETLVGYAVNRMDENGLLQLKRHTFISLVGFTLEDCLAVAMETAKRERSFYPFDHVEIYKLYETTTIVDRPMSYQG